MYIPFNELPPTSRIWVYQSDRKLTKSETEAIKQQSQSFLNQWAAHGSKLACSSEILYDHFLIIAVNEDFQQPSGCSIDSSVRFIQSLENQLKINFMDRTKIAFLKEEEVILLSLQNIKDYIAEGIIDEETLIFNNLIDRKEDLQSKWLVPSKLSWLKRYFKVKV